MAKYLVIVESPSKINTIKKFLGSSYEVAASNGHVRDLPKSQLGFNPENDYEPKYITIRGKGDVLAKLRKEVKKADKVFLATDPDREGEAIAWHLAAALKLPEKEIHRIQFNEITKTAVKAALAHPGKIDIDKVNAQQTRRMLDRMVGYRISPLLWAKVKRGLSAGRVQSAVLRMICDRENEIAEFVPKEYWTLEAQIDCEGEKKPVTFKLNTKKTLDSREELDKIIAEITGAEFTVADIKTSQREKKAPLPFTTSTMQQAATQKLNFPTAKTMRIAQQLYEGIELKGKGATGMITYLRTDSTRIADEAATNAAQFIRDNYGEKYVAQTHASAAKKQAIQDAHEAIRPTDLSLSPTVVKDSMSRDQFKLYQLIYSRFLASQMAAAQYTSRRVELNAAGYRFDATSTAIAFEGFLAAYMDEEDKATRNAVLNHINEASKLSLNEFVPEQHFTQPQPHFNEASLVKAMEELGIGRPSTYAPTISTLLARRYVSKENKNLYVTELGEIVNQIMVQSFGSIVDVTFTANLESLLDAVSEGQMEWKDVVRNFYPDLDEAVKQAEEELEKVEIKDEVSDVVCEKCGRLMVIKYGPHGKFLACPGYPECKNTKTYLEKIGVKCPKCGKDIVIRKTRKDRRYYGCIDYPNCDYMTWQRPKPEDESTNN
ncbi:MAG: type I DNA topoisomerase [Lachnospiraceae bacterium]|nr:type I DNA topoisomerase [Lachnospiraceae bacterium]